MIGLDTNVVIRYLAQDDPVQSPLANRAMETLTADDPGFLCREVLVEIAWVLERAYKVPKEDIVSAIKGLLSTEELIVETADQVGRALAAYRRGQGGFADAMIVAATIDCGASELVTFDGNAAQLTGARQIR